MRRFRPAVSPSPASAGQSGRKVISPDAGPCSAYRSAAAGHVCRVMCAVSWRRICDAVLSSPSEERHKDIPL